MNSQTSYTTLRKSQSWARNHASGKAWAAHGVCVAAIIPEFFSVHTIVVHVNMNLPKEEMEKLRVMARSKRHLLGYGDDGLLGSCPEQNAHHSGRWSMTGQKEVSRRRPRFPLCCFRFQRVLLNRRPNFATRIRQPLTSASSDAPQIFGHPDVFSCNLDLAVL